jgi:hypothetical protein
MDKHGPPVSRGIERPASSKKTVRKRQTNSLVSLDTSADNALVGVAAAPSPPTKGPPGRSLPRSGGWTEDVMPTPHVPGPNLIRSLGAHPVDGSLLLCALVFILWCIIRA